MVFGLLPKIERAIETTERVEARFQAFADEVQPVMTVGAGLPAAKQVSPSSMFRSTFATVQGDSSPSASPLGHNHQTETHFAQSDTCFNFVVSPNASPRFVGVPKCFATLSPTGEI